MSDARWRGALAGEGGRGGRAALGMAHSLGGPSHPVTTPRRPIPRKWSRGSLRLRYSCASPAFGGRQGPVGHCPAANRRREHGSTALSAAASGQEYHRTDPLFFAAQHCFPCQNACRHRAASSRGGISPGRVCCQCCVREANNTVGRALILWSRAPSPQ